MEDQNLEYDKNFHEARELLASMRLDMSEDRKSDLATDMVRYREMIASRKRRKYHRPSKSELLKKSQQFQGAIGKAKKLYNELLGDPVDLDDIPPIKGMSFSNGEITLFRDESDERLIDTGLGNVDSKDLWWLQMLHIMGVWGNDIESGVRSVPAWNEGTYLEAVIERMAIDCRRQNIKISAAENSQFYKISSYIDPDVSDIGYRIKKIIDKEGGQKKKINSFILPS